MFYDEAFLTVIDVLCSGLASVTSLVALTPGPVSIWMDDRQQAGEPFHYATSTQPGYPSVGMRSE